MTNHEKYKAAFSVLQPTQDLDLEADFMNGQKKTFSHKRVLALCAVVLILAVAAVSVVAADVGGIQTTLKMWFHGQEQTVEASEREDGGYDFAVTDENGDTIATFGGGGVAMENGKERPLTPQEVLEGNVADVVTDENGRTMLYYYDKSFDITDLIDADGVCRVKVKDQSKRFFNTVYFEIEFAQYEGGLYSCSMSTSTMPKLFKSYTELDG